MAAVSIVGSTASLARRAESSLETRGIAVASVSHVQEGVTIADALDSAARHPATTCVLILAHAITDHGHFAGISRAASPHVPIIYVSATDMSADAHLRPWLASIGLLELPTLGDALDALPVVTALDSPAGARCMAVGGDEALIRASAASIEKAGFVVDFHIGQTLADASVGFEHDLILTVLEEPIDAQEQLAVSVAEARAAHPELPLIVVADGSAEWGALLRRLVDSGSVCVAGPTVELGTGLTCLGEWERSTRMLAHPRPRPRDASRLRRVVSAMKVKSVAAYSPATQADLIGALGLPYARSTRVGYLEDCLIAAAELGYPLRLAAVHAEMRLPEEPAWVSVPDSSQLMRTAESVLSTANRLLGRRAELVIAEAQKAAMFEVRVLGLVHPDYGVVVHVSSGGRSTVVIPPMSVDSANLANELELPPEHTTLRAAVADGVLSAYSALTEVSGIAELALSLDVGPTGFSVRHAMISMEDQR